MHLTLSQEKRLWVLSTSADICHVHVPSWLSLAALVFIFESFVFATQLPREDQGTERGESRTGISGEVKAIASFPGLHTQLLSLAV